MSQQLGWLPPYKYLQYPETVSSGSVGHLFRMNPSDWRTPALNIAYSRGKPAGQTIAGNTVQCCLLVDDSGQPVPCIESHTTCQGSKVCPQSDIDLLSLPHETATRDTMKERLQNDREEHLQSSSLSKDVFLRTMVYLAALKKLGCSRPFSEETFLSASEEEEGEACELYLFQTQRGYRMPDGICEGRVVFDYDDNEQPYHHNRTSNKDHFHDLSIGDGSLHIDYIEVVISGDESEAARIEEAANDLGYGLLFQCTTVANFSSQKAFCCKELIIFLLAISHRDENKGLGQILLQQLSCRSKFRVFEPVAEFQTICPFVLIIANGDHPHPVPLPMKTPPKIHAALMELLESLGEDLPDITPRRFIQHPLVKAFLAWMFPSLICPTLADWHAYIKQAREQHYPFGPDWAGVINLKEHQDSKLPQKSHYIRCILAIDPSEHAPLGDDEDEEDIGPAPKGEKLWIIVCMTPEASRRLVSSGQYLQSDIGFKRLVGFKEFEVASMERDANTSIIFCRIYLNRMTTAAHQRVFEEIEAIVLEDTKTCLKWHHLHVLSPEDSFSNMILSWAGDQHRGQAKGKFPCPLFLYAQSMSRRKDLYETHHFIQDLMPYEHLHRNFRVCGVHYFRLVKICPVPDNVRWHMQSLRCMEHPDWDGTLQRICNKGGKAGNDWVKNKQYSQFVFEGICWEKSFIPPVIWEAGDSNLNFIESVHCNANREGVHCTLVGGLKKGQAFDALKMKTLQVWLFLFCHLLLTAIL
ncbi:hypothetical protein B0H10DRAFT_1779384 [Mycena sp. CBHHK59/15]|nr:hypothetical protein B0H10DRAFT_1779384 [Mycena sp. CBHHK59/15]